MPFISTYEFFATCLPGMESLLAAELQELGIRRTRPLGGGVTFYGEAVDVTRVCLWSRLAGRVTVVVDRVNAATAEELYEAVRTLPWEEVVAPGATMAVRATGTNRQLRNTQFIALKVKDAVCDRLVEVRGSRPDVDARRPDASVEVRLREDRATVSLDLSGGSLHRRSYLSANDSQDAPLAVAQAAGLLAALDAAERLGEGWGLLDPACDDGLLVCEAASVAADQAPGLVRSHWGFRGWAPFDEAAWNALIDEADDRFEVGLARLAGDDAARSALADRDGAPAGAPDQNRVRIVGLSASSPSVARARALLKTAGLRSVASIEAAPGEEAAAIEARLVRVVAGHPLLIANVAPVARAADDARAVAEQAACVAASRRAPEGSCFGFVSPTGFAGRFGTSAAQRIDLGRGRTEAVLERFDAPPRQPAVIAVPNPRGGADLTIEVNDAGAAQFAARLRKVARERRKWAQREGIHCYRVYDADLPEYAAAIDIYEGVGKSAGLVYAHVAEYQAPKSVDEAKARARFEDMLAIIPVVLDIRPDHVFSKARLRARGGSQYRDAGSRSYVTHTLEDGLVFELDLGGYLDTGLFLDHRVTREMVGRMAAGKTFLNLFAYTAAATVHAAAAGAVATTTVDLSSTYLEWAERNLEVNGFSAQFVGSDRDRSTGGAGHTAPKGPSARKGMTRRSNNQLIRADVTRWIQEARRAGQHYDVIFADPPTFSNSKAMGKRTWDVQRDHVELLIGISRLLTSGGVAVFSCNLRTFKPDTEALARYGIELEDITARTIPHDFERNPRIHHCYLVKRI